MNKASNNINIIVDFDLIVKNITPTSTDKNHYNKCDKFVTYKGESVEGTTITMVKDQNYMLILESNKDSKSKPTKLNKFIDDDLELTRLPLDNLKLECLAKKENKKGNNVTIHVHFDDPNGKPCIASWDPKVIVEPD